MRRALLHLFRKLHSPAATSTRACVRAADNG